LTAELSTIHILTGYNRVTFMIENAFYNKNSSYNKYLRKDKELQF